mmetsp:Transcript_8918/g.26261  ORF Transcript_8918/g.26261 Transcript_8918/m.26261 type:complete len:118 (-) Transcript_8918:598-951(-)
MNSDDLVQIWLHTFPQLEELEAYEVASSHRPTPHNRGVAQLQVNKSTAAAASTMAAAATPGSNPFNNPPQQSRRKPSSSGLALPGRDQYADLIAAAGGTSRRRRREVPPAAAIRSAY